MLRAVLLLLATSEVVAVADEGTGENLCAETVPESSSAYPQSPGDWHFSLTFKVFRWVPKMHISIAFGEQVEITQVSGGASEVDQYYYGQGAPSRLELPTVPTHTPCVCHFLQWTRIPSWSSWTKEFTIRIPSLW
jgi:hypothetical protein